MREEFFNQLVELVSAECVQIDEIIAKYTTFKIGGPADYMVTVDGAEQLGKVILLCKKFQMPYYMIGKGSNLLVSDDGYRGVILRLANGKGIQRIEKSDPEFEEYVVRNGLNAEQTAVYRCQAGVSLIAFALEVSRAGYTGFEFATGIPGSLGGAVAMNAGAYGGEIQQVLLEATAVDANGVKKVYTNAELKMGYRRCVIQDNHSIVTEAVFAFEKGDPDRIMAKVKELGGMRTQKQPLEYPSAGSTFKRPEGYFAGKLIMDAGLRGYQVGDAQVAEKHCGFVINKGNATAKDVTELIHHVQATVKEKYGVELETEVKLLGFSS